MTPAALEGEWSMDHEYQVTWRRTDADWTEQARFLEERDGLTIAGTISSSGGTDWFQPAFTARYHLRLSADWSTTHFAVSIDSDALPELGPLELSCDSSAGWCQGESGIKRLARANDIDLFLTPATNSIPIRRLDLAIGDSVRISALLVSIEDPRDGWQLTLDRQCYERLDDETYRFSSLDEQGAVTFTADLTVRDGIVLRYGEHWFAR
ncbi:MAG TPA: putative glycolipid-binding domain-containing protein [Thermomicrobiales bacterium]|nr:putative glycolipid-binding domain-containing protein [Thermomicrobiales bacterium]